MGFTVDNPYREDLPLYLRKEYFATEETAQVLASHFGGEAFLEPGGSPPLFEPAWFIAFPGKRVPWNAGELYEYLQKHVDYNPAA